MVVEVGWMESRAGRGVLGFTAFLMGARDVDFKVSSCALSHSFALLYFTVVNKLTCLEHKMVCHGDDLFGYIGNFCGCRKTKALSTWLKNFSMGWFES